MASSSAVAHVTSPESKLVREVVQTICKRLNRASPCKLRGLVGVDSRVEQINNYYPFISSQYEGCHFVPNIRQESEKGRLSDLRDELLSKLLEEQNLRVGTPHIGPTFIRDRLCQKKVHLVLDDVNDVRQFQHLIEVPLIGLGSVVVVTSIDRQVLKNVVDEIHTF
ncbi:hypothetical protein POTOM_058330 [Populus tomentosa]|uniref:NB-ARC domain-containing protein n=1 Tax=Populus tomentosa TaxID=118781 RepID=A0A8X7XYK4_POPTO|nr:hypothetical protein POTOM_058330 [Populus tomentosa]